VLKLKEQTFRVLSGYRKHVVNLPQFECNIYWYFRLARMAMTFLCVFAVFCFNPELYVLLIRHCQFSFCSCFLVILKFLGFLKMLFRFTRYYSDIVKMCWHGRHLNSSRVTVGHGGLNGQSARPLMRRVRVRSSSSETVTV